MKYKLCDVTKSANTGADAIKRAPIVEENTGLRCLRIGDVSQKRSFNEWGYTKTTEDDYKRYKLEQNDIIIARTGNTIGVNCFIENDIESVYNNGLIRIKADTDKIIPKFMYYIIRSQDCQNFVQSIAYGTSTQPNIKIQEFLNFEFEYYNKDVQSKIVSIIDSIDKKIELNNSINNNLEQQIFALFDNLFPNVRDGENTISNYFSPKRGKNLLSKNAILGDVPVIAGGLNPATYHNVANTNAPVITISASGANAGFVNLWHIPVWSSDSSFIDDTITGNIYFWYVMLKKRQQEIFDSQTGSAQPHIYPQHIEGMTVSDIDMNLVNDFNDNVTPLFINMGENIKENQKLIQLRDTLLPKLMSGEIDVSKVEIDDILENPSEQSSSADKLLLSEDK